MLNKRTYKMFIEDIITAMEKIQNYISNLNYETFLKNEMIIDACIRNLEIIGEASKNIPKNIREKYPDIPWKRMIALKNIAIHEYFGVDLSIIWEIITKNLPETKPNIKQILKNSYIK